MKNTRIAIFSLVIIIASVAVIANFELDTLSGNNTDDAKVGIKGHLTVLHISSDGEIIDTIKVDNVITNQGKDCASEILFARSAFSNNNNCPITYSGTPDTVFNVIGLYSTGTPAATSTAASPGTTAITDTIASGLGPAIATVSGKTAAGSGGSIVEIKHTFTAGAGVTGQAVKGAKLMIGTASDGTALFATTGFNEITMRATDTLDVTWSITIG